MTIKSVSYDQQEILRSIMDLCQIERVDADLTYGNGQFWKEIEKPLNRFDIDDSLPDLTASCSSVETPLADSSISSCMFDPPFLTYVRQGRDKPTSEDIAQAEKMVAKWNCIRLKRKQKTIY